MRAAHPEGFALWIESKPVPLVRPLRGLPHPALLCAEGAEEPTGPPVRGGERPPPSLFLGGLRRSELHSHAPDAHGLRFRGHEASSSCPSTPTSRESSPARRYAMPSPGGPSLSWRCCRTALIHSPVLIRICCKCRYQAISGPCGTGPDPISAFSRRSGTRE